MLAFFGFLNDNSIASESDSTQLHNSPVRFHQTSRFICPRGHCHVVRTRVVVGYSGHLVPPCQRLRRPTAPWDMGNMNTCYVRMSANMLFPHRSNKLYLFLQLKLHYRYKLVLCHLWSRGRCKFCDEPITETQSVHKEPSTRGVFDQYNVRNSFDIVPLKPGRSSQHILL